MVFTATVSGNTVNWASAGWDYMTIQPKFVTSSQCCGTAVNLDISVDAALNTRPNPSSGTVAITFTNSAPNIGTAVSDKIFSSSQGETNITELVITDPTSDSLTFVITTNASASDYTTLSIDSSDGNPITIEMNSAFRGIAEMTVTATDSFGNAVTDIFNVKMGD